jgi:hypothetical protein
MPARSKPVTEDRVREDAYYMWEKDGRPDGKELYYWLAALKAADAKPSQSRGAGMKKSA